jgi:hypothetical protein
MWQRMQFSWPRDARTILGALAAVALLATQASCALSVEPLRRASTAPVVVAHATTPKPAEPAGATLPADKDNAQAIATPLASERGSPHIALILPLTSKTFSRIADAVKQGFVAGADAEGKSATPYRIYPADDESASLARMYRKAVAEGAIAVVGGVTRDGANTLEKEAGLVPSLALNAPNDTDTPDRFYYISLNLDWEAKLIARSGAQEGFRRVAIISGNSALAKRIADSFEKEWIRSTGEVAARIPFADNADGVRVKSQLERARADVVFFSLDPRAARSARPYVTGTPVFATSQSLDARADVVTNLDLDGVRFMEMPWFVEQDHPAVMAYSKPPSGTPLDNERLYALGIDAWRLMQLILKADKPRSIPPLDGVTGKLTLDGAQFVRGLATIEIRGGVPAVIRAAE